MARDAKVGTWMPKRWLLIYLGVVALTAFAADSGRPGERFLMVDGVERRYLMHVPPDWAKQTQGAVILMLHGAGGTPEHAGASDLNRYADRKGFLVVYPEGLDHAWNDGRPISGRTADDVAFLSALIDELVQKYSANPRRVYVTGISNGGFMSFTLACRISDKIAGIAPVAASMGVGQMEGCHPRHSISVMMINGTADPIVRFDGGQTLHGKGSESESVRKVVEFWRSQVCGSKQVPVKHESLPDVDRSDGSTVEVERVQCPDGEVVTYAVKGGGHTWPGTPQYMPRAVVGNVNRDFSASAAIVDFFSSH
jgi:polyhydroxybutyrate depolymerase